MPDDIQQKTQGSVSSTVQSVIDAAKPDIEQYASFLNQMPGADAYKQQIAEILDRPIKWAQQVDELLSKVDSQSE